MATVRTVNRLIRAVLSDILNIYNPEQTISAADSKTVLEAIQDRLAAWTSQITIPVITTENFAMIVGTAAYTIGQSSSPSLNTPRPDQIIGAYVRVSSYDHPVNIWSEAQYRGITDKTTSGRPTVLYPKYSTPNITITLHPVPDTTDNLYFSSIKIYTEPTTYTQDTFADLGLPGLVYNALKWRIAIDVAPGYRAELSPAIGANATEAFSDMVAQNLARNMNPAVVEMAMTRKQGSYSLSDFYAGE